MDFPGIQAQSVGVHPSAIEVQVYSLKLYAGPNQTGAILAQINVQTIDEGEPSPNPSAANGK